MFSSQTQVLLSDGSYKNIDQVTVGDTVLNKDLKPVKVVSVQKGEKLPVIEVRYENWFDSLHCSGKVKILCKNGEQDSQWVNVAKLSANDSYKTPDNLYEKILPNSFKVTLGNGKTLEPTQDVGLLFGLYAGFGHFNEIDNEIVFTFGPNEFVVNQVKDLLHNLFDANVQIEKDEFCFKVKTNNDHASAFFKQFGKKLERQLPKEYLVTNEDYVKGLYQGLVDYDPETKISRYIAVSKQMAHVFLYTCSLLGLSFTNDTVQLNKSTIEVYPLLVKDMENTTSKIHQSGLIDLELDLWSLTVDCPTNSFIVNNLIVSGSETI